MNLITKKIPQEVLFNKHQGDIKKIAELSGLKHSTVCTAFSNGRARPNIYNAIINFFLLFYKILH